MDLLIYFKQPSHSVPPCTWQFPTISVHQRHPGLAPTRNDPGHQGALPHRGIPQVATLRKYCMFEGRFNMLKAGVTYIKQTQALRRCGILGTGGAELVAVVARERMKVPGSCWGVLVFWC